jgi:hypothetical protein
MLSLTYKVAVDELNEKWDWPMRHWQMYLINELNFRDDLKITVELTPDAWSFTQVVSDE